MVKYIFDDLCESPPVQGEPHWAVLADPDPLVQAKVRINRTELALAIALTPRSTDEVHRTAHRIAGRLGVTTGRALAYCDIATMLHRLPATAGAVATGAFCFELLRILADVTCAVDEVHLADVDAGIAALLTPTRPGQAVPGPRVLRRRASAVIADQQPSALPVDPDAADNPPSQVQLDFQIDTRDHDHTVFHITLPADEATGVTRIIDAVAAAHSTSRAGAFTELIHGMAGDVTVTLNCYRDLDSARMHLENQWLGSVATDRWMRRVTHLTVPSHSAHDRRYATTEQKALLAGVDGTCRAPGCERPAATADTDHIHRYGDTSGARPRTDTRSMQQLCRACHNAKTRGLLDYTRHPDATTSVTSIDDGHTVVTVPTGPLADAVLTFDRRLARRVRTRAAHHAARIAWRAATRTAAGEVVPF